GAIVCRERADAPAAPQIGRGKTLDHARGALRVDDAAPQAMPRIRGDGAHRLLLGVERQGVEAEVVAPEALLEGTPEALRPGAQGARARRIADRLERFGHAHPGVEDVALQLAERLGRSDLRTVRVDDRVAGVLPAHVLVALRRAAAVLLEAVAIEVAV